MHLVHLFLPLHDNMQEAFAREEYALVRKELTERFGGLTVYTRAPAEGMWKPNEEGRTSRDDIVIFEVMATELDTVWWADYRRELEIRFRQEMIFIRAQQTQLL